MLPMNPAGSAVIKKSGYFKPPVLRGVSLVPRMWIIFT